MQNIIIGVVAIIAAPVIIYLLKVLGAGLTSAIRGESLSFFQPLNDLIKLFQKKSAIISKMQIVYIVLNLVFSVSAFITLCVKGNLLIAVFLLLFSEAIFAAGTVGMKSVYGVIGAQRLIVKSVVYASLIILAVISISMVTDTFSVDEIFKSGESNKALFLSFPLVWIATVFAFMLKTDKKPFSFGAGLDGKEICAGILTDYSGKHLAILDIVETYKIAFFLGFIALFFGSSLWVGVLVAALVYLVADIMDSVSISFGEHLLFRYIWPSIIALMLTNMLWVYLK